MGETHPHSHAVAIGVWIENGTRDEPKSLGGISHLIEHLVFKGTKTRTSFQIAKSLEQLGGELNAFTTREYTCYHCLVLKDHWKEGLEILSDLVSNMKFSKEDFILERGVVLQEIAMTEDSPEDLIYDLFLEYSLKGHSLGKSILGTPKTVGAMKARDALRHYKSVYSGKNMIVSVAGNIDYIEFEKAVQKLLGKKTSGKKRKVYKKPGYRPFVKAINKPSEQLHCLFGFPVSSFKDDKRFEAFIVNALLGGGMTSRLYQAIREKKGLVYNIHSSLNTFIDYGMINIYASCETGNMKQVILGIEKEILRLLKNGVRDSDVELFKTQVIGSIMLGADDIDNRMNSIAINEMVFQKYKPIEHITSEIEKVTPESVNQFIQEYIRPSNLSLLILGREAEDLEGFLKERKDRWKKLS